MTARQSIVSAALVVLCVIGCRAPSQAAVSCVISATAVAFGNYDVFKVAPTLSNGTLTYTCNGFLSGSGPVTIFLNRGSAPTFNPRFMLNGAQHLNYNLYRDAALTLIWGDGTGGTSIYSATATNGVKVNVTVFGRVPAGQDLPAGSYIDSITATINF